MSRKAAHGVPLKLMPARGLQRFHVEGAHLDLAVGLERDDEALGRDRAWMTRAPRGSESVMSVGIAEAGGSLSAVFAVVPSPLKMR